MLRLPLGRDHLSDDDIGDASPAETPSSAALVPPASPSTETGGSEVVLLVEDDPDLRDWLRAVLSARYSVLEAEDGARALELATEQVPDLVLTDAMMPVMDGLALCKALRETPATSHLPVVMLSARAATDRRVEGLGHGADAYLRKPVHPDELLLQVRNLLDACARLRARYRKQVVLADDTPEQPSSDERLLTRVREAIHEHIDDPDFGVSELALAMAMSRRQLGRKLSALTGAPPSQLLREVRLQRARALLDQDTGTISEVAYAVGFRRPARFSEQFRAVCGVSPSEYKRDGITRTEAPGHEESG